MDYDRCLDWCRPSQVRKPNWKKNEAMFAKIKKDENRMAEIMGDVLSENYMDKTAQCEAYTDRARKDLGRKTHRVTTENFENWYKQGFRPTAGEFDLEKMDPAKKKRYTDSVTGLALRK